jgi:hypothetical protein
MTPNMIAALVDGAIPLLGGIYCTLLGFRVVGKPPGASEEYDAWHRRFGTFFRVGGPFLILFGLFQMARGLVLTP